MDNVIFFLNLHSNNIFQLSRTYIYIHRTNGKIIFFLLKNSIFVHYFLMNSEFKMIFRFLQILANTFYHFLFLITKTIN